MTSTPFLTPQQIINLKTSNLVDYRLNNGKFVCVSVLSNFKVSKKLVMEYNSQTLTINYSNINNLKYRMAKSYSISLLQSKKCPNIKVGDWIDIKHPLKNI